MEILLFRCIQSPHQMTQLSQSSKQLLDAGQQYKIQMSLNQNGLYSANWKVVQSYSPISEGAVVGISFGWIIGVIGLYILGLVLICKCVKNLREDHSEDGKQKRQKDQVKKSSGLQINLQRRKKYEQNTTDNLQEIPRKRIPENLHTQLEMMDSDKPSQPQSITYKLRSERQN